MPGYTESFVLGSGASGRVVLAVHEETGVPVAVKYLSESLCTRPGFVRDFRAEARLLGGLESPFVTELYEYVESPDGAAIVMELVDGVSLRAVLRREAELGPEAALVILKGSLLGLADAHRVGVVHRDYKPENVLVAPDGSSKLVDFGIAVDAGTRAGVAGTPSYMAPEQWTGAPASPAADVYAAAATFFECLTGHKPYRGDNMAALALQHVDAPVPADEVPEAVRELVRRGLAKDPEERPAQAEEFVGELEAAALAGYGPDWEERGRGRLAALVALLPLLLPSAHGAPRTTTDTARTVLRQEPGRGGAQAWLPGPSGVLVSGAALLLGAVLTFGLQHAPGADTGQVAQALATTSAEGSTQAAPPAPTDSASSSRHPPARPASRPLPPRRRRTPRPPPPVSPRPPPPRTGPRSRPSRAARPPPRHRRRRPPRRSPPPPSRTSRCRVSGRRVRRPPRRPSTSSRTAPDRSPSPSRGPRATRQDSSAPRTACPRPSNAAAPPGTHSPSTTPSEVPAATGRCRQRPPRPPPTAAPRSSS
ncbi:serine/threonine-protein kinase [Streptomyces brasiliscabiei]|uniref:serine/threonine-protein kinase n=1 Tax=Streptomyces brasiliscabiei TaxID=2736302 RepID=UPI0038F79C35